MGVVMNDNHIALHTKGSTYQMAITPNGILLHLYYGKKLDDSFADCMARLGSHTMSPFPFDEEDDNYSLDICPLEYPAFGSGDYRSEALKVTFEKGESVCDLRFVSAKMLDRKPSLEGLPSLRDVENEAQTLEICLQDRIYDFRVYLLYSVYEKDDVISRSVRIENHTGNPVRIDSVYSACIDHFDSDFDLVTFCGRAFAERNFERTPLGEQKLVCESRRGSSSHQKNPFLIFCKKTCHEFCGECYGASFVYSGSFMGSLEKTHIGTSRFLMGINPVNFSYTLENKSCFQAPEVILSYSEKGFSALSHHFHNIIRKNILADFSERRSGNVLINSWEAAYFDFDAQKLIDIAKKAKKIGADTFVLDDGWFLGRNNASSSLGDWYPDEAKLGCTLSKLAEKINHLGLKFGLWFEPECVCEKSILFAKHPEWCMQVPNRHGAVFRNQMILDMANPRVTEALYDMMSDILGTVNIEYIKWDFNRNLSDVYSSCFPAEQQGEITHRYVLGVYSLLEKIRKNYPDVLIEGCSSGGGRFDCGILYYCPQIWASDNTDPICRTDIHYGTSFGYPIISMGSHVTASPNHCIYRETPIYTRSNVAMSGTYGFELDLRQLDPKELDFLNQETAFYRKYFDLIKTGDYYRLSSPDEDHMAWQFVSPDGTKSLLFLVQTKLRLNYKPIIQKLHGLQENKNYRVLIDGIKQEKSFSGCALMNIGLTIPKLKGEYGSVRIELLSE